MIEFEEYKSKLSELKPKLEELRAAFLPQSALDELERLHAMAEAPGFWDDPARSQKAVMRTKQLEHKRDKFEAMCSSWDTDVTTYAMCEAARILKDGGEVKTGDDLGAVGYEDVVVDGKVIYGKAWLDFTVDNYKDDPYITG